jgi:predicted porin
MKKSLVALAVLGAISGAASAQTAVNIYGLLDAGIVTERGAAAGNTTKLSSGVQNGSRLGFRGTEDLGGGLAAKFALEAGFGIDDGRSGQSGRLFGRQAFVGLGNGWGNVTLGRQYTPYYLALDQIDPFHSGLAGNAQNLFPTVQRMDNTIKYSTPEWIGFIAELAYGFGEVAGDTSASRQVGVAVGYTNGPLLVKLTHHRANGPQPADFERPASGVVLDDRAKRSLIGGRWDFGVAAAHLAFGSNKGGLRSSDNRLWLIGATVPLGASTFLASYIRNNDRTALDQDANQWALGYTFAMSKRTNFYTSYGHISNDNGATYTVGSAIENGSGDKAFNIGIRHQF